MKIICFNINLTELINHSVDIFLQKYNGFNQELNLQNNNENIARRLFYDLSLRGELSTSYFLAHSIMPIVFGVEFEERILEDINV